MTVNKIETWRRLTRLELQQLCSELSAAALATINDWPASGEGRAIKATCEWVTRELEHTNAKNVSTGIRRIDEVVARFRGAMDNEFYREKIATRKLRSGKWKGQDLGAVVDATLSNVSSYIAENGPLIVERELAAAAEPPAKIDELQRITPAQQIGPVQFEMVEGRLRVRRQEAHIADRNDVGAEEARLQLVADANWLIENLNQSNIDRRSVAIIQDIGDQLTSSQNVIRVGIANVACEQLIPRIEEELPAPIISRLHSFNVGVMLYVSQFSDWHTFVDNAAERDVRVGDAKRAYQVGTRLVSELKANEDLADPEVPRSLELLLEAVTQPERAGKRAVFALIRTIENLIAKVFSEFGGLLNAATDGLKDGLKKAVTIGVAVTALGMMATAATNIAPAAKHVLKTDWLKKAGEIVSKSLDDLD